MVKGSDRVPPINSKYKQKVGKFNILSSIDFFVNRNSSICELLRDIISIFRPKIFLFIEIDSFYIIIYMRKKVHQRICFKLLICVDN